MLLLVARKSWNQLTTGKFHWCSNSLLSGISEQWEGVLGKEGQNYTAASASHPSSLWL